ncbi:MAG: TnpV protein [Clostridiales bacterium]|jgi:ABC-type transport system involved in cytochrome c biogenesis ATPase subunit|nr:TnpV protein [Clostridiales bacterium]
MKRKALYTALWLDGELDTYLANIDRQAQKMFFQLVKEYADRQGITERLKAENQMEWVGRMNNCKAQAEEVIMAELIYV